MTSNPVFGFHYRDKDQKREENDFYATSPRAIPPLLKLLGWENGGKVIRENSCGQGHLSMMLQFAGHTVIASDLVNRGHGITGVDFLQPSWLDGLSCDGVIMNPPYVLALPFVKKSLTLAPVVCAFLRLTWLESKKRRKFFDQHPPHTVAVFSERIPSAKNGDFTKIGKGGPVAYAWFIWRKGHQGPPQIIWI